MVWFLYTVFLLTLIKKRTGVYDFYFCDNNVWTVFDHAFNNNLQNNETPYLYITDHSDTVVNSIIIFKANMESYIPLETTAKVFLANLFLKQGISSEYVMVFIVLFIATSYHAR